jgi:hypothetical protein
MGRCGHNEEDAMARLGKSVRETVNTASEAVWMAAEAVHNGRQAVRTAKKAGTQAKQVATKVMDRVTGREAARRKKGYAIGAGVATAAVLAGVAASRVRRGRKH